MSQNTDELKLIIDVASERGVMQERCAQLEMKNDQLTEENIGLRNVLQQKEGRIKELERMLEGFHTEGDKSWKQKMGQPVVVVNQYFLLDRPKTINYVCSLDADHRVFAGHFLMHTLPDNTPKQVYDQVTEMTRLTANPSERMADALEKVAEQPRTENIYGDKNEFQNVANYNGHVGSQNNTFPMPQIDGQTQRRIER